MMPATITVRTATISDHQTLIDVDGRAKTHPARAAFIEKCLPAGECLIGEIGTEVFGFVVLNHSFFGHGFVPLIVVAAPFRRRGLALSLLAAAAQRCKSEKLFTSANTSNKAAQALFERAGFVKSGRVENLDDNDPELIYFKRCGTHG
jgi:ribosomal protein S18 acetylase RimI-like enzyme